MKPFVKCNKNRAVKTGEIEYLLLAARQYQIVGKSERKMRSRELFILNFSFQYLSLLRYSYWQAEGYAVIR